MCIQILKYYYYYIYICVNLVNRLFQEVNRQLKLLQPLMNHFNIIGKSMSETFEFWLEYCDMVFLLLDFIAAERESNWHLHLETFAKMLQYDRAYDHYKYFSWGLIYLFDMHELPSKHPDLYHNFVIGNHAVSRNKNKSSFNSVSTDMALEQSMNRDSKTKGGIVGVTQDINAVEKWTLTAHLRAAVHANFKEMCGVLYQCEEKELSKKTIIRSEAYIVRIMNAVNESSNPFVFSTSHKSPLKNIVSGSIIKDIFRDDILNAKRLGKSALDDFIKNRFVERSVKFLAPITKLKLHTFSSEDKPIKISRKNEATLTLRSHQNLFTRLITVSTSRQINLKTVLSHELTAVPLSLFYQNGDMRKTNKSVLLKELEIDESSLTTIPTECKETSATIIDFMAVVQSFNKAGLVTFSDLAKRFEPAIFSGLKDSRTVVLVPDRYDVTFSIKSDERSRRQKYYSAEIEIRNDDQKLPKSFQSYLDNPRNKINLVTYIFNKWIAILPGKLTQNQHVLFANLDGTSTEILENKCNNLELITDHEEADSKIFVYCKYLCQLNQIHRIVIESPDTDVAVICCYQLVTNLASLSELWFKTGVGKNKRYIPIHTSLNTIGASVCRLLPAVHAITGCDSVSSFSGVGKKTAFSLLKSHTDNFIDLLDFGDSPILSLECESVISAIKFVCSLYDRKFDVIDVNVLRHKLFTQKNVTGDKLPPTLDALSLHLRRANYQCYIWKSACEPRLELPQPIGNGWINVNGTIEPERMITPAVPDIVVELTRCKCGKGCKTNTCSCRKAKLSCSDACLCSETENCENCETEFYDGSSDEEEDD